MSLTSVTEPVTYNMARLFAFMLLSEVCLLNLVYASCLKVFFFFLFEYQLHTTTTQNLQDYTTESMEIHSNPVAITNNKRNKSTKIEVSLSA